MNFIGYFVWFLEQNVLITQDQNVSQGAEYSNTLNLYTTGMTADQAIK